MSKTRPQTPVLIFSIIAVIAMIAVVFLINHLTSKDKIDPPKTTATGKAAATDNEADSISLTVNGKHVDSTLTGHTSSPEQLVGHISEIIIRANDTGDLQPFIQLIGHNNLSPAQIRHLQKLASSSRLKLNETTPFSAIKGTDNQWELHLADKQRIQLNLTQKKDGGWGVDQITLPNPLEKQTNKMADTATPSSKNTNTSPAQETPKEKKQADAATAVVQHFIDAILQLDPTKAGHYIDKSKVSYATLAGLCIIVEEARYLPIKEKAVRNMFLTDNTAGWLIRVESPNTEKTAMFALSSKRKDPQSPWKITEVNLDKLLSDYAIHYSGGNIHYIPLVKNPEGGDSIVLYFKLDSNELSERTKRQLSIVANLLKSTPDKKLTISGHTDASGSDDYNLNLSNQRAAQVRTFLTQQGVIAGQIKITSFGKSQPRQPNTTDEGRRANRRAEIRLNF